MTVRVEHQAGAGIADAVVEEIRSRCEVRAAVEVLAPGTLPRTEFKAARVKDRRDKSRSATFGFRGKAGVMVSN